MVATRQDFSYAIKAGMFAGATTVAAKPEDTLGSPFGDRQVCWLGGWNADLRPRTARENICCPSSELGNSY